MSNKIGLADYGLEVWYGGCYNLAQRLELLKECGIDGIECLKASDMAEAVQNAALFHRMGMDFASCSMASPELTLKCACAFGKEYVWFPMNSSRDIPFAEYCRRANGFVQAAAWYNLKGALHNHLGCRVESQQELEDFMQAVPGATLLLDIAHMHAAGGDCVELIRKYHQRLAAVHFKDIYYTDMSISLDRWWQRLRFCELGGGNAGLDYVKIAEELIKNQYHRWILIEQDTHLHEPQGDLKKSAGILRSLFS